MRKDMSTTQYSKRETRLTLGQLCYQGPTYPRSSNDIAVYKNGQRMFYNVDYTVPSSNNSVIFNHPHTFGDDDLVVVDYILRTNSTS